MRTKWTSRKFWLAVVGEVSGLVTLFAGVGASENVAIIAGAVIAVATALGYLYVEGGLDSQEIEKEELDK